MRDLSFEASLVLNEARFQAEVGQARGPWEEVGPPQLTMSRAGSRGAGVQPDAHPLGLEV